MKGDFSRITFDPGKHYRGVLHQQGRVWLDSDWNEDVFERLAVLRQELRDAIGPNGFPSASDFQISANPDTAAPDNFQISAGHAYVNGNLAQIDNNFQYLGQPDFPDAPRLPIPTDASTLTALVYLDVWYRLITYLEDDSIREVALGGPDTSARLKIITQVKVVAIPNGTSTCQQASQFLPTTIGGGLLTTLQPAVNPTQAVCQLPDPANFTGRENHLYRVQVHDGGDVAGITGSAVFTAPLSANAAAGATTVTVNRKLTPAEVFAAQRGGFITIADNTGTSERIALTASGTATTATSTTLTLAQPLVNAYTTANAAGATGGVARFKWSRDNASFAVGITAVKADRVTVTLASLGRDLASALRQGDLVELTDDASELGSGRGHLTFLKTDPDPDLLTAVLNDPLPASFALVGDRSQRHLVLRRWDGVGDAAGAFSEANTPGMNLGDGVHIQFAGSDLHPGDYWNVAARAADGSIEALTNAEAHGTRHSFCPLAIVTWGPPPPTSPPSTPTTGFLTIVQECRRFFPALVNFPQAAKAFHVNSVLAVDPGNVQSVLPNDTNVQINAFAGIDVVFDAPPDPASISRPTAFMMAEHPISPGAYFPIALTGTLATTGATVSWRALPATLNLLNDLIVAAQADPHKGVLMRLTLKGPSIWAATDPNMFLDGTVFGQASGTSIALRLPSGDGRRGYDFEMWFWLVAAPSFPKDITINPNQIFKGGTATVTVTFTSAALSGSDPTVVVTSSNPAVAAAPAAPGVPVATGAISVTFNVTGLTVGTTSLSAKFNGQTVAASLDVVPPPSITGQVTISPSIIFIGGQATGSITLTAPAPAGGATIALASSAPAIASVPANVVVSAGSATASFNISGGNTGGTATITAALNGSVTGAITVRVRKPKDKEIAKDIVKEKEVRAETKLSDTKLADKLRDTFKVTEAVSDPSRTILGAPSLTSGTARSFIRPEERPAVEDHVLQSSGLAGEETA